MLPKFRPLSSPSLFETRPLSHLSLHQWTDLTCGLMYLHCVHSRLLEFFISHHIKSHKKPKLYFYTLQSLNFIHANVYKWIFWFLKKFEYFIIILYSPHFPHSKPLIEIVSFNFTTAPYTGVNWGSEPLFLLIQNRAIKHFKKISRKIHSSHCFLL